MRITIRFTALAVALLITCAALAGDEQATKAGEAAIAFYKAVIGGSSDTALEAAVIPFAYAKDYSQYKARKNTKDTWHARLFETKDALKAFFEKIGAQKKEPTFTKVESAAKVSPEDLKDRAELAKALPTGGWRVTLTDASGKNNDAADVYLTAELKVAGLADVER